MNPLPETPEFARFKQAMQDILKVSKKELLRRLEAEKKAKSKAKAKKTNA